MKSNQSLNEEETFSQFFCLNAVQMMYSMYFTPDCLQMNDFPQIQDSSIKETKVPFQSRVADLKLRRFNEKSHEIQEQFNDSLQKLNESNNQNEDEQDNNIDDAFIDPPAPRPKKYKYLTFNQKEKYIPKTISKGLDFKKIAKEQKVRLDNARERGANRAKRRMERMKNYGQNNPIESSVPNSEKYYQFSENSEPNAK